jgi:hypothetical protein
MSSAKMETPDSANHLLKQLPLRAEERNEKPLRFARVPVSLAARDTS